jgi:hypothetical protein
VDLLKLPVREKKKKEKRKKKRKKKTNSLLKGTMSTKPSPTLIRLCLSGAVMFLVFGLIFAAPPLYENTALFPNTRLMKTLHLEGTQNGLMLVCLGYLSTLVKMGPTLSLTFELSAHVGAWMNVIPWLYGAYRGIDASSISATNSMASSMAIRPDNDELMSHIVVMLVLCMVGDIIAWGIVTVKLWGVYGGKAKRK